MNKKEYQNDRDFMVLYPVKLPLHDILLANGYEIDREKS